MTEWRNDDLLLTEAHRRFVEAEFPGALAAFDFPELRELFASFDSTANAHRRRRQRTGMVAALIAAAGAVLSTLLPVFSEAGVHFEPELFAAAASLSFGGLAWSLLLALHDPRKEVWLQHRLRTERLRQFYFQLHASDPLLVARAMTDEVAAAEWQAKRRQALDLFAAWLQKPMRAELTRIVEDVNDSDVWFVESWRNPSGPFDDAVLEKYFAFWRKQRAGVQLAYVREKLAHGISSPRTRLRVAETLSWALTFAIVVITSTCAIRMFFGLTTKDPDFVIMTSLAAFFGILAVLVKTGAAGLQLRGDTKRYEWYRAAIEKSAARLEQGDPVSRIQAIHDIERASYRELREFLVAHDEASFSFG